MLTVHKFLAQSGIEDSSLVVESSVQSATSSRVGYYLNVMNPALPFRQKLLPNNKDTRGPATSSTILGLFGISLGSDRLLSIKEFQH